MFGIERNNVAKTLIHGCEVVMNAVEIFVQRVRYAVTRDNLAFCVSLLVSAQPGYSANKCEDHFLSDSFLGWLQMLRMQCSGRRG